jgi:TolB-like protein/lipoprotein NlpI
VVVPLKQNPLRLAILIALVLLVVVLSASYFWRREKEANASTPGAASIAVLPFTDLSPRQDQQYFTDGLAEELITDLAQVPGLRVVARSSAFEFRGRSEDLRSVGHKLGVSNILEGSVRKERDRFRISVELTNTESGFQIWSQTYDRKIGDIFAVQDEIAAAVSGVLEIRLLGANGSSIPTTARRTNPEAYQAYLQGRYFEGRSESKEDLENALSLANQAITLDPRYAPAWVLRSSTYNLMAGFGFIENSEGMGKARQDARRAIALDPAMASAHLALGYIQLSYDWDWIGAETSGRKAAESEPGSADVLRYQSSLDEALGRLPEAIENQKRALMIDPILPRSYTSLGAQLYEFEKYEEARNALHKALEMNPQKEHDHAIQGEVLLAQGRPEQALMEIEREPSNFWRHLNEALVYQALNRQGDSDKALNAVIATDENGAAFEIAEVYAYRGESDKAFAWLDRAYRQRDGGLTLVKVDPLLKNLRRDPRYSNLLMKMHFPM